MAKNAENILKRVIRERPLESHKGDYGRLLLIGGTYPYGGAIIMAALAAVNSGAGLVTVATDRENIAPLHSHLPEAMAFDLEEQDRLTEQLTKSDLVLIGPGLAENQLGLDILQKVVQTVAEQQILIMDGGAISLFSKGALPFPKAQTVFTPHNQLPLGSIVVQKKHGTTIYQSGQEQVFELTVGGPYQATGGMGDTLAGMIAAFAGQFKSSSLFERVAAATLLHSLIADELSQEAYVVLPTAISRAIPRWMKEMSQ